MVRSTLGQYSNGEWTDLDVRQSVDLYLPGSSYVDNVKQSLQWADPLAGALPTYPSDVLRQFFTEVESPENVVKGQFVAKFRTLL